MFDKLLLNIYYGFFFLILLKNKNRVNFYYSKKSSFIVVIYEFNFGFICQNFFIYWLVNSNQMAFSYFIKNF